MKKEIKLGCPMEYEIDNVIYNGLFLRENEANIVFKELEKFNKQKKVLDKIKPMLKELNIKIKDILNIGIDIKEISDILELLEEIE